jgi:hypothetical protein
MQISNCKSEICNLRSERSEDGSAGFFNSASIVFLLSQFEKPKEVGRSSGTGLASIYTHRREGKPLAATCRGNADASREKQRLIIFGNGEDSFVAATDLPCDNLSWSRVIQEGAK